MDAVEGPSARAFADDVPVPGLLVTVPLPGERFDTGDLHDPALALNSRLTATVAGIYQVTAQPSVQNPDPTSTRILFIRVTRTDASVEIIATDDNRGAGTVNLNASTLVRLAEGDYVEMVVGGAGSTITNAELMMVRVDAFA